MADLVDVGEYDCEQYEYCRNIDDAFLVSHFRSLIPVSHTMNRMAMIINAPHARNLYSSAVNMGYATLPLARRVAGSCPMNAIS